VIKDLETVEYIKTYCLIRIHSHIVMANVCFKMLCSGYDFLLLDSLERKSYERSRVSFGIYAISFIVRRYC
jgi:hypothetical protein